MMGHSPAVAQMDMSAINQANFNSSIINVRYLSNMDAIESGQSQSDEDEGEEDRFAVLNYKATPALRRKIYDNLVSEARASDPSGARIMHSMFDTIDPVELVQPEMDMLGLRTDNVADAMTFWLLSSWYVSHDRAFDPRPSSVSAVRAVLARNFIDTPQLASATDEEKQQFAESLVMRAAYSLILHDVVANTPTMKAKAAAVVGANARAQGFDLTQFDLTDKGFVPR